MASSEALSYLGSHIVSSQTLRKSTMILAFIAGSVAFRSIDSVPGRMCWGQEAELKPNMTNCSTLKQNTNLGTRRSSKEARARRNPGRSLSRQQTDTKRMMLIQRRRAEGIYCWLWGQSWTMQMSTNMYIGNDIAEGCVADGAYSTPAMLPFCLFQARSNWQEARERRLGQSLLSVVRYSRLWPLEPLDLLICIRPSDSQSLPSFISRFSAWPALLVVLPFEQTEQIGPGVLRIVFPTFVWP